ncbi:MAG: hypothetical protein ACREMY_05675 [bacterium]
MTSVRSLDQRQELLTIDPRALWLRRRSELEGIPPFNDGTKGSRGIFGERFK